MKMLKRRADLLMRWQFTEGRRARAIWIDGKPEVELQLARVRHNQNLGSVRRVI